MMVKTYMFKNQEKVLLNLKRRPSNSSAGGGQPHKFFNSNYLFSNPWCYDKDQVGGWF